MKISGRCLSCHDFLLVLAETADNLEEIVHSWVCEDTSYIQFCLPADEGMVETTYWLSLASYLIARSTVTVSRKVLGKKHWPLCLRWVC